jgi:hypothetical protein
VEHDTMKTDDDATRLHQLADDILHAPPDTDIAQMMANLTPLEAEEVAELVAAGARRMEYEARLFTAWAERERAKGRPEAELIFGNVVRETGVLWRDGLQAQ